MGKFDGVLLASDFDNTLLNTETARRTGAEVRRCPAGTGRRWSISWRRAAGSLWPPAGAGGLSALRRQGAHERPRRGVQRCRHL